MSLLYNQFLCYINGYISISYTILEPGPRHQLCLRSVEWGHSHHRVTKCTSLYSTKNRKNPPNTTTPFRFPDRSTSILTVYQSVYFITQSKNKPLKPLSPVTNQRTYFRQAQVAWGLITRVSYFTTPPPSTLVTSNGDASLRCIKRESRWSSAPT